MDKYYDSVGQFHKDLTKEEEKEVCEKLKVLRRQMKDIIFSDNLFPSLIVEKLEGINSNASITTDYNSNSSGNNAAVERRVLDNVAKGKYHACNFKEEWLTKEFIETKTITRLHIALEHQRQIIELENRLVTSGLKAAVTLAIQYKGALDPNDAIQQANLGLMEAAKRFDPDKGVKFITFAYHKMEYKLRHQSSIDAANVVRIPAKDKDSYASGWLSLEEDVDVGRQKALQDILPDTKNETLDSIIDKKKIKQKLKQLIFNGLILDAREILIIYYRYLFTSRVLTYQEVAEKISEREGKPLSRERIRQLEGKAIDKLKKQKTSLHELFSYYK